MKTIVRFKDILVGSPFYMIIGGTKARCVKVSPNALETPILNGSRKGEYLTFTIMPELNEDECELILPTATHEQRTGFTTSYAEY